MQPFITILRLTATAIAALCLSVPSTAQPPLIVSGMDAVVGQAGWYTSDVTIHTATFADPEILAPAADIRVEREGLNEVPIPDGLGGTATQFVNVDKTAPVVSINDLYLRDDGATILSVNVSDPVSGPVALDVSLDNGKTWQTHSLQNGYSAPEVVWSLGIDPGKTDHIQVRAADAAGNMSPIVQYSGAVE